jgi:hypothetical protein
VAAWIPAVFGTHVVKNNKMANNSATTEAKEKNNHRIGICVIL